MGIDTGHSIADGDITGQELLISELPVQPSMSADDLQKRFDALGLFIKGKYNTLVADLENAFTAAGITNDVLALPPSGSEGPLPGNDESATTVAGQLNYLFYLIDEVNEAATTISIGNDTISDAKLKQAGDNILPRLTGHLNGTGIKHTVAHLPTGTTADKVALGNHTHSGYAATSHDHDASDIGTGKLAFDRLPTGATSTTVAVGNHGHAASSITSGTLALARIPTGTTSTTVALGSHAHAATSITSGEFDDARIPLLGISKISGLLTALGGKQDKIDGAASTVTADDLAPQRVLYSDNNGKIAASTLVDTTKLNYLSGVTASIQTQLNGKQATITGAASSVVTADLPAGQVMAVGATGKIAYSSVTTGELYQLKGIDTETTNIQGQLNGKAPTNHNHSGADITTGTVPVARLPIIYNAAQPPYAAGNIWLKPIT